MTMGKLFGGGAPKPQPLPPPPPPTPMVDEEAIKRAKKLAIATSQQRSGRQSTILSESDTLGA